mmetsp:Transcript_10873/g.23572  ORF Transcript_10873/g.23572 Transcript_10873/m.23572 type:complete len:213 (-) Transcript_10873:30-668(-)
MCNGFCRNGLEFVLVNSPKRGEPSFPPPPELPGGACAGDPPRASRIPSPDPLRARRIVPSPSSMAEAPLPSDSISRLARRRPPSREDEPREGAEEGVPPPTPGDLGVHFFFGGISSRGDGDGDVASSPPPTARPRLPLRFLAAAGPPPPFDSALFIFVARGICDVTDHDSVHAGAAGERLRVQHPSRSDLVLVQFISLQPSPFPWSPRSPRA